MLKNYEIFSWCKKMVELAPNLKVYHDELGKTSHYRDQNANVFLSSIFIHVLWDFSFLILGNFSAMFIQVGFISNIQLLMKKYF